MFEYCCIKEEKVLYSILDLEVELKYACLYVCNIPPVVLKYVIRYEELPHFVTKSCNYVRKSLGHKI